MMIKSIALYGNHRNCAAAAPNAERLYPGGKVAVIIEPNGALLRRPSLKIDGIEIAHIDSIEWIDWDEIDLIIPVSPFQSFAEKYMAEELIEAGAPEEKIKHDILLSGLKKHILCGDMRKCKRQLHIIYDRREGIVTDIYNYYKHYRYRSGHVYFGVPVWNLPENFSKCEFDEVVLLPEKEEDISGMVETLLSHGVPKEKINAEFKTKTLPLPQEE